MEGAGTLHIVVQHREQAAVGNRVADSQIGQAGDAPALQRKQTCVSLLLQIIEVSSCHSASPGLPCNGLVSSLPVLG